MANIYLACQSNKPGSSLVVLIDNEPSTTGYRYMGFDVGAAAWDKVYSGPRGTQGARLAGATAQNRLATWQIAAVGTSHDNLEALLSALWQLDEELRRYGGTITWRPQGGTFLMYLTVLDSGVAIDWSAQNAQYLYHRNNRVTVNFGIVAPPYFEGADYDIVTAAFDDFQSPTEFTFDSGAAGNVSVSFQQLTAVANLTTENRMIHTARGYSYGDQQVSLSAHPGSTISGFKAGVVLKRLNATNYLEVYVDDNGTSSRLRLDKIVAGVRTNLATSNLAARVVNGTDFLVRGRIEGSIVYREYFTQATADLMETPTLSGSTTLTGGDATLFGFQALGSAGLSWIPQQAAAVVQFFRVEPYTYRAVTTPVQLSLNGQIPGDAPALGSFSVSIASGSLTWALLSWLSRDPFQLTMIYEAEGFGTFSGWSIQADANYRGGSGLKRTTTGAVSAAMPFQPYVPDDYRGSEVAFEVWARVQVDGGVTNPVLAISTGRGVATPTTYSAEYGSTGKLIAKASSGTAFRFVRLGTLTFPVDPESLWLQINGSATISSGAFGLDYLILVPTRSRAVGATGKPNDANYPDFMATSGIQTKLVRSDLSGAIVRDTFAGNGPDSGLGGALIELPPGDLDVLAKFSSLVPDDPTSDTTSETLSQSVGLHVGVTPRWRLARSS